MNPSCWEHSKVQSSYDASMYSSQDPQCHNTSLQYVYAYWSMLISCFANHNFLMNKKLTVPPITFRGIISHNALHLIQNYVTSKTKLRNALHLLTEGVPQLYKQLIRGLHRRHTFSQQEACMFSNNLKHIRPLSFRHICPTNYYLQHRTTHLANKHLIRRS